MTQVVGFTPEDWPIARDAINAVRRGGLEHPFHRRRNVVGSGDELVLIRYTGTTCALGAAETYGIEYEGDCEIWDHLVTGADTPSPMPTGTANARFLFGMILFPDQFCWARFTDGIYWVTSGGTAFFTGSLTDGGPGTGTVSAQGVELECTELCGVDLVAGQEVAVNVETQPLGSAGFDTRLIITRACCPDIDGD